MIFDRFFKKEEPKPCPYCGSFPDIKFVGENKDRFILNCSKCGETVVPRSCGASSTVKGAIKSWNRWADIPNPMKIAKRRQNENQNHKY